MTGSLGDIIARTSVCIDISDLQELVNCAKQEALELGAESTASRLDEAAGHFHIRSSTLLQLKKVTRSPMLLTNSDGW